MLTQLYTFAHVFQINDVHIPSYITQIMNDKLVKDQSFNLERNKKTIYNESFLTHQGGTAQQQDINDDPHPQQ